MVSSRKFHHHLNAQNEIKMLFMFFALQSIAMQFNIDYCHSCILFSGTTLCSFNYSTQELFIAKNPVITSMLRMPVIESHLYRSHGQNKASLTPWVHCSSCSATFIVDINVSIIFHWVWSPFWFFLLLGKRRWINETYGSLPKPPYWISTVYLTGRDLIWSITKTVWKRTITTWHM